MTGYYVVDLDGGRWSTQTWATEAAAEWERAQLSARHPWAIFQVEKG